MKILAIANQKGGVGKTTTAVNLSVYLAGSGARVLLVDLDPQANATSALGMETEEGQGLYQALVGDEPVPSLILPTRFENLSLLPSDLDLAGAEIEVARMDNPLVRLKERLVGLPDFDYVLLDCPPSLGILMTNALAAAHEILAPIQCEYFALEGLSKIVRIIQEIRDSGHNPGLALGGIVMTMFDGRTNLSQQVVAEVQKHFGEIVYQTLIPRTIRLGEAPSFGKAISEYDPHGTGATAYHALAVEFLRRQEGQIRFINQPPTQPEPEEVYAEETDPNQ